MNARGVVVALALCVFTCSMPALSAADSWWSGLSGGKSTSSTASKKGSSSSWWPWTSSSSKPKSKSSSKPSTFDKMTKSTKSAWTKTVDFLNPFDDKSAAKAPAGSMPNTGNWFGSSTPQDKPSTVPEWMAGERPTF